MRDKSWGAAAAGFFFYSFGVKTLIVDDAKITFFNLTIFDGYIQGGMAFDFGDLVEIEWNIGHIFSS